MDMYIQAAGTWQAVWIISLSRIQLYNELNLFCAALRACTQQPNKPKTYVRSLQINRIEELELFCIFTLQSDHHPRNPSL